MSTYEQRVRDLIETTINDVLHYRRKPTGDGSLAATVADELLGSGLVILADAHRAAVEAAEHRGAAVVVFDRSQLDGARAEAARLRLERDRLAAQLDALSAAQAAAPLRGASRAQGGDRG